MRNKIIQNKYILAVSLIIIIGIFFRFYNISWGDSIFFHPDERNIASSISQLTYPNQMNPHFFAYGSLPIYSIYFSGMVNNYLQNFIFHSHNVITEVRFENAIIIGRAFSFFLSIILIYLIYLTSSLLGGKMVGYLSVAFSSLSIGYIQYAHFTTFEIWLSFFTLFLCYLILRYIFTRKYKYFICSAIICGMLISTKISSSVFLPLSIIVILISDINNYLKTDQKGFMRIERIILKLLVFTGITLIVTAITSPYFWSDNQSFLSSIRYESSVALGTLSVFYSQGFVKTTPLLYQFLKDYPFTLNPVFAAVGLVLVIFTIIDAIKNKNKKLLVLISFFLVAFISQAFLYVKWIRYYIPTLSFIYIFAGFQIAKLLSKTHGRKRALLQISTLLILVTSIVYSFSYFKTVFFGPDTRIAASMWANKNIAHEAIILSEVYDMGIVPFNKYFNKITLFNFYDLDVDVTKQSELDNHIHKSEYIIIPSQRVMESRIKNPKLYPKGHVFYQSLIDNRLGFKKIYETPCDMFCKILYLNDPKFRYEQTANVFDRPTLMIFKKIRNTI